VLGRKTLHLVLDGELVWDHEISVIDMRLLGKSRGSAARLVSPTSADVRRSVLGSYRPVTKEASQSAPCYCRAASDSRCRTGPPSRPRSKDVFAGSRQCDVKKSAFLIQRRLLSRNDLVLKRRHDRCADGKALRATHCHDPNGFALGEGSILTERPNLAEEPTKA
jgi:hypothetical protein